MHDTSHRTSHDIDKPLTVHLRQRGIPRRGIFDSTRLTNWQSNRTRAVSRSILRTIHGILANAARLQRSDRRWCSRLDCSLPRRWTIVAYTLVTFRGNDFEYGNTTVKSNQDFVGGVGKSVWFGLSSYRVDENRWR